MRALILEDDKRLARFLSRVLTEEGLSVDLCLCGADAVAQASGSLYDLFILDWMVPDGDGLWVCREVRRAGERAPVLMLTARGETRERVMGLDAGADDYMVKPFEVAEFLARVRALLRRSSGLAALRCGELEVEPATQSAKLANVVLSLTHREYAVLLHMVHRGGQVVRRSDLLSQVWGLRYDPGSNVVDVHISRLREKLGERAWMIETVRGAGYRLRAA